VLRVTVLDIVKILVSTCLAVPEKACRGGYGMAGPPRLTTLKFPPEKWESQQGKKFWEKI